VNLNVILVGSVESYLDGKANSAILADGLHQLERNNLKVQVLSVKFGTKRNNHPISNMEITHKPFTRSERIQLHEKLKDLQYAYRMLQDDIRHGDYSNFNVPSAAINKRAELKQQISDVIKTLKGTTV
jgi:hypothetical protein